MKDVNEKGIYTDLMRKFRDEGHDVYVISPCERREGLSTAVIESDGVHTLSVKTLNLKKTNVIEKGLGQFLLEFLYQYAMQKYFKDVKFDLILYSTPPISLTRIIWNVKSHNPAAKTYLMLKDIFPQNAIDLGLLTEKGMRGLLYRYFRKKEKKMYKISDYIGCMSPANVDYILKHNPEINPEKVEICPNSFEPIQGVKIDCDAKINIRSYFQLPTNIPIFIYGGNLGKPQGIAFLLKCLEANKNRTDCHFVVIGDGTEYPKVDKWVKTENPKAVSFFHKLPKPDYDKLVSTCDIGLIFLDYRFTIPNYPSRLLSYLMSKIPIIVATDPSCDTGVLAEQNGYGIWCPSNSPEAFTQAVDRMLKSDLKQMGENGYRFYLNNYTVQHTYNAVMNHFKK